MYSDFRKKPCKAVVFDMDGVIFDTERLALECWQTVAARHGIPDIKTTCRICMGTNRDDSRRIMLERYGSDFPYDVYRQEVSAVFSQKCRGGGPPMKDGVTELLSLLKSRRILVALASSTGRETVTKELSEAGIISFFDQIICGDMVRHSKPDPEIYRMACEKLRVPPEESYAIEDSYKGIQSAYAAGLRPIMVPDQVPPTEEMERLSAAILPSLSAVGEYLI